MDEIAAIEYLPFAQRRQVEGDEAPNVLEYLPESLGAQAADDILEYVPRSHTAQ